MASISEDKPRGRSRKKPKVAPARQCSRSIDRAPPGSPATRIRKEPTPSRLNIVNGEGHFPTSSKARRRRPKEIQELRGYPDPVTTISAEAFRYLGHDLQSNLRQVFQGLHNALESGSAVVNPKLPPKSRQNPGRLTRAAAHESNQFFKTLSPNELTPEHDHQINVLFEGTNTITTHAPGYTETIMFGGGRWSRTRNGTVETGKLEDDDEARITEQMKRMIDGVILHTASGLAGMMHLDTEVEPPLRSPT